MQAYVKSVLAIIIIIGNQLRQWTAATLVSCGECAQWVVGGSVTRDCGAPVSIESPFL